MRKGIDHALFRKAVVDREGNIVSDTLVMVRPSHGIKEVPRRHAAKKAAKQSRKAQQILAAVQRRARQRKNSRVKHG